jgi:hypothetical protein
VSLNKQASNSGNNVFIVCSSEHNRQVRESTKGNFIWLTQFMIFFSVSHSKSLARSLQVDTGCLVGIKRKKIFGLIRRRKGLVSYLNFLGESLFLFSSCSFFLYFM